MRRVFVATSFAAVLSVAQASATESVVVTDKAVASGVVAAVPATTAVVADPALATTAVVLPNEASRTVSSTPVTGAGLSASQAMASTAYPAAKRPRTATNRADRQVASSGYDVRGSNARYARHSVLMLGVAY
jgi:uncharacterized membrane protein YebE (DUF533 family)